MSRNLGRVCGVCKAVPELVEPPRMITQQDARDYFREYRGMIVANAECTSCGTKYLAWVDSSTCRDVEKRPTGMYKQDSWEFFDLSYRSTFNDEPGEDDLPDVCQYILKKHRQEIEKLEACIENELEMLAQIEKHVEEIKLELAKSKKG